jgi:hypothetical protein
MAARPSQCPAKQRLPRTLQHLYDSTIGLDVNLFLVNIFLAMGSCKLSSVVLHYWPMAKKKAAEQDKDTKKQRKEPGFPIESGMTKAGKPSAVVDTRVIYCGDNLEQLKKLRHPTKERISSGR